MFCSGSRVELFFYKELGKYDKRIPPEITMWFRENSRKKYITAMMRKCDETFSELFFRFRLTRSLSAMIETESIEW